MSDDKPPKSDPASEYAKVCNDLKRMAEENKITKAPPPPPTLDKLSRIPVSLNSERSYSPAAMRKRVSPPPPKEYPPIKADPSHWTKEVQWGMYTAAILVTDLDPRDGLGSRLNDLMRPDVDESVARALLTADELALLKHAKSVYRRATGEHSTLPCKSNFSAEDGYRTAKPADFAKWLLVEDRSPVPVPEWMKALAPDQAQPPREQLESEIADLLVTLAEKEETNRALEVKIANLERQLALALAESERLNKESTAELEPGERKTHRKLAAYFFRRFGKAGRGAMLQQLETQRIKMDPKTVDKLLKLGSEEPEPE